MRYARTLASGHAAVVLCGVAAATGLGYLGRSNEWLGVWRETEAYLGNSLIVTVPVVVGLSAWLGARRRRDGLELLAAQAAIPRIQVRAGEALELGTVVLAGFLLGVMPAVVATMVVAEYGHLRITSLLVAMAMLVASCVAGLWAGARLPGLVAGPLMLAATYVLLGFLSVKAEPLLASVTPLDATWAAFFNLRGIAEVSQLSGWVLVAAGLLYGAAADKRRSLALFWLAGLAFSPALYLGSDDRAIDPRASEIVCVGAGSDLAICLPQAKGHLRPQMQEAFRATQELTKGLKDGKVLLLDDEARGLADDVDEQIEETLTYWESKVTHVGRFSEFMDLSAYTRFESSEIYVGLAGFYFPMSAGQPAMETPLSGASPHDVLVRWYFDSLDLPLDGSAAVGAPYLTDEFIGDALPYVEWLTDLGPEDREEWFVKHRSKISDGAITFEDFGDS